MIDQGLGGRSVDSGGLTTEYPTRLMPLLQAQEDGGVLLRQQHNLIRFVELEKLTEFGLDLSALPFAPNAHGAVGWRPMEQKTPRIINSRLPFRAGGR